MHRSSLFFGFLITSAALQAQSGANPISKDVKQAYETVKNNLLKTADKVSEQDFGFKPTPEIRSFGEVLGHAAMAQNRTCAAVVGESAASLPEGTSKSAVSSALKQAFSECDKAYDSLTDANAADLVKLPYGQKTRLGALAGNTTHDTEQYAILSVYMRLKGIVPPSSERSSK